MNWRISMVSRNERYFFGGLHFNKVYSIFGSILGSPYFGKLLFGWFPLVAASHAGVAAICFQHATVLQSDRIPDGKVKDRFFCPQLFHR